MPSPSGSTEETENLLSITNTRSYGAASISNTDAGKDDSELSSKADGIAPGRKRTTPLPYKQLSLIFLMRLPELIAYFQIFPYINDMMLDIGASNSPSQAGYYSGIIESSFAITELLTVLWWGRLSDRLGRKPVLLLGSTGSLILTFLFGFSKSLPWALVTRSLSGALASGNPPVCHSAIADITDETNQAHAFISMGLAVKISQIIGFSLGGFFAKPTITFPNTFGRLHIFVKLPYLLPCLISALITVTICSLGAALFRETLPRQVEGRKTKHRQEATAPHYTVSQILKTTPLLSVLTAYFFLSGLNNALWVVFPLFAYTPVESGGLGQSIARIGSIISASSFSSIFIQLVILPRLQRTYNIIPLYLRLMSLYTVIFGSFPLLNLLARSQGNEGFVVMASVAALLAAGHLASTAYSLDLVLTKSSAPSHSVLGVVFGISQLVNCVARSVAPAFISSLFALSKGHNLLSGNLVWYVMILISLLGLLSVSNVKVGAAPK